MILVLNITTNDVCCDLISYTPDKVAIVPQFSCPKLLPEFGKLLKHFLRNYNQKVWK